MKFFRTILLLLVLGWSGCSLPWEESIPSNDLTGDYSYTANAIYFDEFGEELNRKTGLGGLHFVKDIALVPLQGWNYNIDFSNFTQIVLSDGTFIHAFDIQSQVIEVKNQEFLVIGKSNYVLTNSDGSFIGAYSGWVDSNNRIYFTCESIDLSTKYKTVTEYTALPR